MSNNTKPKLTPWCRNEVQFPRLISELQGAGAFTDNVIHLLSESMDLTEEEIFELVERADTAWEAVKAHYVDKD